MRYPSTGDDSAVRREQAKEKCLSEMTPRRLDWMEGGASYQEREHWKRARCVGGRSQE